MKVGILLVTFAVSWCPISCRNRPFICNNASEPTFGEIFQLLSPAGIDLTTPPSYQSSNSFPDILINVWGNIFSQVSQSFYSIKFPLAYLVSDGVFTLSHVSDHYGDLLADAVIIKEKHWSQRLICSLARRFAPSHSLSTFCGCWSGLSLLQYYGERRAKDYLPGMSEHDWCVVTEPCQGQFSSSDLHCRIVVDPLTSACVASSKFSLHADPRLEQIVSYRLEVRTLKTQNWDETISLTFLKLCHSLNVPQLRESCYSIYDYSHLHIIPFICQTIPIYIVNALIAVTFLSIEDSVASHPLLRFVVAVVLGLILALIWALVVLYRSVYSWCLPDSCRLSHKIFNVEGIPFVGNLIQPGITAIFLGFSVMFTSSTIQQYLLDQILVFWLFLTLLSLIIN